MPAASLNYTTELTSGVIVTYWRATSVQLDLNTGSADVSLSAWLNEAAYVAGLKPVTSRVVTITPASDVVAAVNTSIAALVPPAMGV